MNTQEYLAGAIDMHIHASPDRVPRLMDAFEIARAARDAGMRAIVLKDHHTVTADRAYMVRKVVTGIDVWGGIVLNKAVGGFNPHAVEAAVNLGAKIVWMPTSTSASHLRSRGEPYRQGLSIFTGGLDSPGEIRAEVSEILSLLADAHVILATGHLHASEVMALLSLAERHGIKKYVVTHPENRAVAMTPEACRSAAAKGAYFEICFRSLTTHTSPIKPEDLASLVKSIAAQHCIMATDLGEITNVSPTQGMAAFARLMLEQGLSPTELRTMLQDNPARLLYE